MNVKSVFGIFVSMDTRNLIKAGESFAWSQLHEETPTGLGESAIGIIIYSQ